jgi:hypothetical protein
LLLSKERKTIRHIKWKPYHTLDRLIEKNRQFLPGKVTQAIARMMLPKPHVRRYQDHHHGRWGSGTHAQLQHLDKITAAL